MRVERERSTRDAAARRSGRRAQLRDVESPSFADELTTKESERDAAIEQLLAAVDEAAQRLRAEGDLPALYRYKEALRAAFASATRQAYKVHAETGFGLGGRRRLLYAVRIVDEKIAQLAELLMAKERDNVAVAARLDEIRGILLDLYR